MGLPFELCATNPSSDDLLAFKAIYEEKNDFIQLSTFSNLPTIAEQFPAFNYSLHGVKLLQNSPKFVWVTLPSFFYRA